MADSIELLAHGPQENVDTFMDGVAPSYVGYSYGDIPLAAQQKGAPVDVSDYSLLRLDLSATDATNRHGTEIGCGLRAELVVVVEHSTTEAGPWSLLARFDRTRPTGRSRLLLGTFDNWVRVSWYWCRPGAPAATIRDEVALTFGVDGTAS